jgi:outer membrane immunogenic protein
MQKMALATTTFIMLIAAGSVARAQEATDWSGLYFGVSGGYATGTGEWILRDNPGDGIPQALDTVVASPDADGYVVGAQIGFNVQQGKAVYGIEGEFSFSDFGGSEERISGGSKPGPREWSSDANWLATIGPRIGYAPDHTMFYLEGGLAVLNQDFFHLGAYGGKPVPPPPPPGRTYDSTESHFGYFLGIGIEHAFNENLSGRIEYNFIHVNDRAKLFGEPVEPAVFDVDQDIHVVKMGLNYRIPLNRY